MRSGRSILALGLLFSFALHAVALAALLGDWGKDDPLDDIAMSVELVLVSAPVDTPADNPDPAPQAAGTPTPSLEPAPQAIEPPAPPPQAAEPPPARAPAPAPPPKPAPKPEIARPAPPKPQPAPSRSFEPPINLNPGFAAGENTQQAKAPSGGEVSPSFSVLHGPIPPYPAAARSRGQEGRVVLDVTIGIDGTPTIVALARSSGAPLLDESAVNTVKTWRFRNDSGRPLSVTVPIVFELRSTAGR